MKKIKALSLVGVLTLSSCASTSPSENARKTYHELGNARHEKVNIGALRHKALRDSALSLGARAGLAWRAEHINTEVKQNEAKLDRIFNFNALMLENYVLPPVLLQGRNTLDKASDDTLRIADRHYIVNQQAKFVTVAPTWRDYLVMNYSTPENPDKSLLPRNQVEKKVWDHFIDVGWQAGISQADTIFDEQLGRVHRDYQGMILYRTLLAQKMVSPPFVAQINFGVTGGDDKMAVNDRVLQITSMAGFNADSEQWETEITRVKGTQDDEQ